MARSQLRPTKEPSERIVQSRRHHCIGNVGRATGELGHPSILSLEESRLGGYFALLVQPWHWNEDLPDPSYAERLKAARGSRLGLNGTTPSRRVQEEIQKVGLNKVR